MKYSINIYLRLKNHAAIATINKHIAKQSDTGVMNFFSDSLSDAKFMRVFNNK